MTANPGVKITPRLKKCLPLFELARVLVGLDHVAKPRRNPFSFANCAIYKPNSAPSSRKSRLCRVKC